MCTKWSQLQRKESAVKCIVNTLKWYKQVIQLSSKDSKIHTTCSDCLVLITALYQKAGINYVTVHNIIYDNCYMCSLSRMQNQNPRQDDIQLIVQEITFLSWKLKVHYCIKKTLKLVSTEPNEPCSLSDPTWCQDCLQSAGWSQL